MRVKQVSSCFCHVAVRPRTTSVKISSPSVGRFSFRDSSSDMVRCGLSCYSRDRRRLRKVGVATPVRNSVRLDEWERSVVPLPFSVVFSQFSLSLSVPSVWGFTRDRSGVFIWGLSPHKSQPLRWPGK